MGRFLWSLLIAICCFHLTVEAATSATPSLRKRITPEANFSGEVSGGILQSLGAEGGTLLNPVIDLKQKYNRFQFDMTAEAIAPISPKESEDAFSFEDIELGAGIPAMIDDKAGGRKFGARLASILPTSKTSQESSQKLGLKISGAFSQKLSKFTIVGGLDLFRYFHEYETVADNSPDFNWPWAVRPGLAVNWQVAKPLSLLLRGRYYLYQDYGGSQNGIYDVLLSAGYDATDNLNLNLIFVTKNKETSNNSLFDQENSIVGFYLGLKI